MSDEESVFEPEVRSPSASPKYVVHWITHARKRGLGMWAWILHRVTAVLILIGAILHIMRNQFGYIIPGGRVVTIDLLLFPGVYHALNGLRVILVEAFGWAAEREDRLFIAVIAATLLFIFYWIVEIGL